MDDHYTLVKTILKKSCENSFVDSIEYDDDFEEYVRKLVAIAVDLQDNSEENLKNLEDKIEENIKKLLLKEDIVKLNHKKTLKRINPRRNKTQRVKH